MTLDFCFLPLTLYVNKHTGVHTHALTRQPWESFYLPAVSVPVQNTFIYSIKDLNLTICQLLWKRKKRILIVFFLPVLICSTWILASTWLLKVHVPLLSDHYPYFVLFLESDVVLWKYIHIFWPVSGQHLSLMWNLSHSNLSGCKSKGLKPRVHESGAISSMLRTAARLQTVWVLLPVCK